MRLNLSVENINGFFHKPTGLWLKNKKKIYILETLKSWSRSKLAEKSLLFNFWSHATMSITFYPKWFHGLRTVLVYTNAVWKINDFIFRSMNHQYRHFNFRYFFNTARKKTRFVVKFRYRIWIVTLEKHQNTRSVSYWEKQLSVPTWEENEGWQQRSHASWQDRWLVLCQYFDRKV